MTYDEWLATPDGQRWQHLVKSFVHCEDCLQTVVHITQDVFEASHNQESKSD